MTLFEKQYHEVKELLQFEDYFQAIKRIIDFTLDTKDIAFYQKTNDFLHWQDAHPDSEETKERLNVLVDDLHATLSQKEIIPHQTIISIDNVKKFTIPISH